MKKLLSVFTAFITALSVGSCFVSAKDSDMFDIGQNLECAKGQVISIPIEVHTGDDFESAELKLIYAQNENGKFDKRSILEVKSVERIDKNLTLKWYDMKDGGYGNIVMFSGVPVKDGVIAVINVLVKENINIHEGELKIVPKLFATVSGGEQDIKETAIVINSEKVLGDSNGDGKVNVRDAAKLSMLLATGSELPLWADYNNDGKVNVRDCAAVANACAQGLV